MKRIFYIIMIAVLVLFGVNCSGTEDSHLDLEVTAKSSQSLEVENPVFVEGNPTCADIGQGAFELKVDGGPYSGTFASPDGYLVVSLSSDDGIYFDWNSNVGVDAVIAKGGNNANVYFYIPESTGEQVETLAPPTNPNNGTPYAISHISFCFDYEVEVEKTAETSFARTYDWDITKTGSDSELVLAVGQSFLMGYDVLLEVAGFTDSDFAVEGTITVTNPAPVAAIVDSVSDQVDGVYLPVHCGVMLPVTLEPGEELVCTYAGPLPDATTRNNVATVTTTTPEVGGNSGEALVDFGDATVFHVDDCVDVVDSLHGPLGNFCAAEAPVGMHYDHWIGPFDGADACGEHEVANIASFITDDSGDSGASTWTVNITVPCETGCTLTPGYWKTHSDYGPAPYDDTWALFGGPDTPFFDADMSWYTQFWTPPKGNAYYILSHAYGAAILNEYNGADTSAVADHLDTAALLLDTYDGDPATMDNIKGRVRNIFVSLAETLDDYNNGLTGPGHCDE